MAFSSGGSGRKRGKFGRAPMAEINVTPMVDVMLVLLIVFMVAAPLLTVGVPVDLPKTQAAALSGDNEPLTISVDAKGQIFLQETVVTADELVPRLTAISKNGYEQRIFVRADSQIDYGTVMDVMGRISSAGFAKVGLVTETQTDAPAKK
ncbi:MAG: protein TolR [Pseudomonadota bacterium]